jgi:hypothetical protein
MLFWRRLLWDDDGSLAVATVETPPPVAPPLPIFRPVYIPPEYALLIRDPRTLDLIGEIAHYRHAAFVHRDVEGGEFEITAHRLQVSEVLLQPDSVVDIRRNGAPEFSGMIQKRVYNAIEQEWTIRGRDLKQWLMFREVIPDSGLEFDAAVSVTAETALKGYVTRHLVTPTDASRSVNLELAGITFDVEHDESRGPVVSFNGRHANLLTAVLQPLCVAAGLWHSVGFQPSYAGYRYSVHAYADKTAGTDAAVVFSTEYDNVAMLEHTEDYLSLVNAVFVMGQGQGALREVREVADAASVTARFRRERSIDSRNNDTDATMDQDGAAVISQSLAATLSATAQPVLVATERYREAWELGDEVTLAIPEIGLAYNRRIVEVRVALTEQAGETVTIATGIPQRTQARIIADALRRVNRVQVE